MRKLVIAALFVLALSCFAGASIAYAGDCCPSKCKQDTCTTKCKPKCSPCKTKCDPCKPKCAPKCDPCKPKCEPCKPKCNPCKPKCDTCKPKCDPCKPKCDPCKPKCDPCMKSPKHPYEQCATFSPMLCAGGCCDGPVVCRNCCEVCETTCKVVEKCDPCSGKMTCEYVYETTCTKIERPRVIPWWFNDKGDGNIYLDDEE